MPPLQPDIRPIVEELINALQVAVLLAQHLDRASAKAAQDVTAITRNLNRATTALLKLRG
jgi:hypothetical protein